MVVVVVGGSWLGPGEEGNLAAVMVVVVVVVVGSWLGPGQEGNLAAVMVVVVVPLFGCHSGYLTKLPVANSVWMDGRDLTSGYVSAPTQWD
jgi:hypothetical protein